MASMIDSEDLDDFFDDDEFAEPVTFDRTSLGISIIVDRDVELLGKDGYSRIGNLATAKKADLPGIEKGDYLTRSSMARYKVLELESDDGQIITFSVSNHPAA